MFDIGKGGYDGDGDITKPENVEEFQSYVLTCTENRGVHFVMADGVSAFSFDILYIHWTGLLDRPVELCAGFFSLICPSLVELGVTKSHCCTKKP